MVKRSLLVVLIGLLAALTLAGQYGRDRGRDRDGYRDRDGRDRRDDYRGERGSRMARIIADCENRTDDFRRGLRRALNRSGLDGSRREDELNADADRLERAMNRVRDAWNGDRDYPRTRRNIGEAIAVSRDINRTMIRRRLDGDVERQWSIVRSELNRMAEAFDLPRVSW